MLDDWSSKGPPDLLYHVPYTWKFRLALRQFEAIVPTNEFNWVDTASSSYSASAAGKQENAFMGLAGERLDLAFDLVYTQFLPNTVPFNFDITVREGLPTVGLT